MVDAVDQQTKGDCLRACVAALLGLPYREVPLFGGPVDQPPPEGSSKGWEQDVQLGEYLNRIGLGHIRLPEPSAAMERKGSARLPWGFAIAEGRSPRGDYFHAVVYDCRDPEAPKLEWDPHESRAGLRGDVESFVCLVVTNPEKLRRFWTERATLGRRLAP